MRREREGTADQPRAHGGPVRSGSARHRLGRARAGGRRGAEGRRRPHREPQPPPRRVLPTRDRRLPGTGPRRAAPPAARGLVVPRRGRAAGDQPEPLRPARRAAHERLRRQVPARRSRRRRPATTTREQVLTTLPVRGTKVIKLVGNFRGASRVTLKSPIGPLVLVVTHQDGNPDVVTVPGCKLCKPPCSHDRSVYACQTDAAAGLADETGGRKGRPRPDGRLQRDLDLGPLRLPDRRPAGSTRTSPPAMPSATRRRARTAPAAGRTSRSTRSRTRTPGSPSASTSSS